MNKNIIKLYMLANTLKNKLRTGWVEIDIEKDRIESISEHIFGCLILAISIDSEYNLNLDMSKVLKMLALHETEEILMPDYTVRSNITKEQKIEYGRKCVSKVLEGLIKEKELSELLDEFNAHKTKESIFCYLVDKIECDFQAKMYDLEGVMSFDKTRKDLKYYGDRADYIDNHSKSASDFWVEYDKPKYDNDVIFSKLICDIQNIDVNYYNEIENMKGE